MNSVGGESISVRIDSIDIFSQMLDNSDIVMMKGERAPLTRWQIRSSEVAWCVGDEMRGVIASSEGSNMDAMQKAFISLLSQICVVV